MEEAFDNFRAEISLLKLRDGDIVEAMNIFRTHISVLLSLPPINLNVNELLLDKIIYMLIHEDDLRDTNDERMKNGISWVNKARHLFNGLYKESIDANAL